MKCSLVTNRPKPDIQGGLWDFAQGYAHLKQGSVDFANLYLGRVTKAAWTSTAAFRAVPPGEGPPRYCGRYPRRRDRTDGRRPRRRHCRVPARRRHPGGACVQDEPEPLPFSAFHWLGAALLENKQFDGAEKAYRAELTDHPHNGWSLLGLQQALAGRGVVSADVGHDFAASWSRSDTWIQSSRF